MQPIISSGIHRRKLLSTLAMLPALSARSTAPASGADHSFEQRTAIVE